MKWFWRRSEIVKRPVGKMVLRFVCVRMSVFFGCQKYKAAYSSQLVNSKQAKSRLYTTSWSRRNFRVENVKCRTSDLIKELLWCIYTNLYLIKMINHLFFKYSHQFSETGPAHKLISCMVYVDVWYIYYSLLQGTTNYLLDVIPWHSTSLCSAQSIASPEITSTKQRYTLVVTSFTSRVHWPTAHSNINILPTALSPKWDVRYQDCLFLNIFNSVSISSVKECLKLLQGLSSLLIPTLYYILLPSSML